MLKAIVSHVVHVWRVEVAFGGTLLSPAGLDFQILLNIRFPENAFIFSMLVSLRLPN